MSPSEVPRRIDNSAWTSCFLHWCGYRQAEENVAMRRTYLEIAYNRDIIPDPTAETDSMHVKHVKSLGPSGSEERAHALIKMLKYNYAARYYGPGWQKFREADIKFIEDEWL